MYISITVRTWGILLVKFIVDEMLGNVVRWLRILGFDTLDASSLRIDPGEDIDTKILFSALEDGRILVTADINLAQRGKRLGVKVVTVNHSVENICQMMRRILQEANAWGEAKKHMMTRCPVCNGLLRPIEKNKVRDKVPEKVFCRVEKFWECTSCGKIYWIGTHFKNINKTIECIFAHGGEG